MMNNNEITWLQNAVKINKLRVDEIYNAVDFCETNKIVGITSLLLDKSKASLKSARHALSLSPCKVNADRLEKLSSMLEGLARTIYSPDGKKMAHEYASMARNLVVEALDIACQGYETLLFKAA